MRMLERKTFSVNEQLPRHGLALVTQDTVRQAKSELQAVSDATLLIAAIAAMEQSLAAIRQITEQLLLSLGGGQN